MRICASGTRSPSLVVPLIPATAKAQKRRLLGGFRITRAVHFGDAWHDTAIFDRLTLPVGAVVEGPAILVQPDTTVLIDPGLSGRVDAFGNTIIEPSEA